MTQFISEAVPGRQIVTDSDTSIAWDSVQVVQLTDTYGDFFDTNEFYKLDATVAKSIQQSYAVDGDERIMMKPGDELRRARMTLETTPLTLSHPSAGRVAARDEVAGIVGDPRYNDREQSLNASLYVPTTDSEAQSFMDEHGELSIGFYSRLDDETGDDAIDAYQRDLMLDHVAIVESGRCDPDDGCEIRDGVPVNDADQEQEYEYRNPARTDCGTRHGVDPRANY